MDRNWYNNIVLITKSHITVVNWLFCTKMPKYI